MNKRRLVHPSRWFPATELNQLTIPRKSTEENDIQLRGRSYFTQSDFLQFWTRVVNLIEILSIFLEIRATYGGIVEEFRVKVGEGNANSATCRHSDQSPTVPVIEVIVRIIRRIKFTAVVGQSTAATWSNVVIQWFH